MGKSNEQFGGWNGYRSITMSLNEGRRSQAEAMQQLRRQRCGAEACLKPKMNKMKYDSKLAFSVWISRFFFRLENWILSCCLMSLNEELLKGVRTGLGWSSWFENRKGISVKSTLRQDGARTGNVHFNWVGSLRSWEIMLRDVWMTVRLFVNMCNCVTIINPIYTNIIHVTHFHYIYIVRNYKTCYISSWVVIFQEHQWSWWGIRSKPSLAGLSVGWFQNDGNVMKCLLSLLFVTKVWLLWNIVPFSVGCQNCD